MSRTPGGEVRRWAGVALDAVAVEKLHCTGVTAAKGRQECQNSTGEQESVPHQFSTFVIIAQGNALREIGAAFSL